ncbi:hypothetical protein K431DRAFT_287929 [Polychaeton citri CBS 116435]|uniref:RRM domain-containing protein n=1 Tax=Polychaeton citri CBS 116435 TaxID=1314669 RepID=A0A9P4Q4P6_9PEZI|nr:hypothetical protein K431DRAFT_287929 [Polychaeton citri CBS 116435]
MSQDQPKPSRKEKRAQRDAERFQKGKKRKHAETTDEPPAVPGDDNEENELDKDFIALPKIDEDNVTKPLSESKKRKAEDEASDANVAGNGAEGDAVAPSQSKRKRRKKQKKTSADGADGAAEPAKHRFLLFIGNLPYNTTDDTLRLHFKKLEPFTLRHRIDPQTKKSKGFAFLEFENYDRMQTCLKLYHHSIFDPENAGQGFEAAEEEAARAGKRAKGRRINVELTAGGGGGNEARKEKIKVKNVRLEEQRKRRMEQEKKEGERKERKQGKGSGGKDGGDQEQGEREGVVMGAMHPSRIARLG